MLNLLSKSLRPYSKLLILLIALQLMQATASLFLPAINAVIVDDGISKGNGAVIWGYGALMLLASAVQILAQISAIWFGAKIAMSVGRDLREKVFDHGVSLSAQEVARFGAPTLITRNTNDVQQVQMLVLMSAIMIVGAPLTMIGGVIMALREDPGLSWLILVAVIALAAIIGVLMAQMTPLFKTQQKRIDTINRVLREQISGVRVIRAFVREPYENARFDQANTELTDVSIATGTRMATIFPAVFLVMNFSSVAIVWFGAFRIAEGSLQVGQLMAYLAYIAQILMSVMMSTMMLMIAPRAAVASARIQEVLNTVSSIDRDNATKNLVSPLGDIVFENTEFRYPGAEAPVLKNINLTIPIHKTTAIIGGTGSGKTTLINLIPRLFDVSSGEISISGIAVKDISEDSLRDAISVVPQKSYLFSGTIASNLRMAKPEASDNEIRDALEIAQALDFVEALPNSINAEIAQGGMNLSGGQRQRIAIARAIIKKPQILIFDDSFSALDVETDKRLRGALQENLQGTTVIIVALRVATLKNADKIVVLENGTIVAEGTHEALLRVSEQYLEIVESQETPEKRGVRN